jgi:S1-C subfamily serine protease
MQPILDSCQRFLACAVTCCAALAIGSGIGAAEPPSADGAAALLALEQSVVDAIARGEKSVVAVARVRRSTEGDSQDSSTLLRFPLSANPLFDSSPLSPDFVPNDFGAGVVIDAAGLVLTNYHVLGDAQQSDFYVWSQRHPYKATVLSADPWYDLAVLRVDAQDLVPITFGDAKQLRKGQFVIALGNPYAIARDGEVSASWGIVANLLRRAPRMSGRAGEPLGNDTLHHYGTLIQTDARLNLGYSGGALLNLRGEMVGLTTSYAASADYAAAAGFAVPVDAQFLQAVDVLKRGGRPAFGFLGVGTELLPESHQRSGRHGVRVVSVVDATPATRGGVQVGDVITHINQEPVYAVADLFRIVGAEPAGTAATVTVSRGGDDAREAQTVQLQVQLTKKYVSSARTPIGREDLAEWRGMKVDDASASPSFSVLGPHLDPQGCVYVAEVAQDSPAWKAGLRPGVYVSHAEGTSVTSPAAFLAATAAASGAVELVVLSGQDPPTRQTVSP